MATAPSTVRRLSQHLAVADHLGVGGQDRQGLPGRDRRRLGAGQTEHGRRPPPRREGASRRPRRPRPGRECELVQDARPARRGRGQDEHAASPCGKEQMQRATSAAGPAALQDELVGAVHGAGLALTLDRGPGVENDGDVHPLHGGLDHVDHVLARHGAAQVQLERDDVGLLVGDRLEAGLPVGEGAHRHRGALELGHRRRRASAGRRRSPEPTCRAESRGERRGRRGSSRSRPRDAGASRAAGSRRFRSFAQQLEDVVLDRAQRPKLGQDRLEWLCVASAALFRSSELLGPRDPLERPSPAATSRSGDGASAPELSFGRAAARAAAAAFVSSRAPQPGHESAPDASGGLVIAA